MASNPNSNFNPSFAWINEPETYLIEKDTIQIEAGPKTDLFMDPRGEVMLKNAPLLLFEADEHFQFSAKLSAELESTFDAAVLVVYANEQCWAKICFELSPQGQSTLVTVVTNRGASDDCNHMEVNKKGIYVRISGLGNGAFAFHLMEEDGSWSLVRYFLLDHDRFRIGFSSQSPTGTSCQSQFNDPLYSKVKLNALRTGE